MSDVPPNGFVVYDQSDRSESPPRGEAVPVAELPGFTMEQEAVESEGEERDHVWLPTITGASPETLVGDDIVANQPRRTAGAFCKKYFCAGQTKEVHHLSKGPCPPGHGVFYDKFIWNRPYVVTVVLPILLISIPWIVVMSYYKLFWVFTNDGGIPGWTASLIMIFGSFVAGATSEGGGSIAYPTMTLILGVPSSVARDFSLMIQSFGMTAGSFTIFYGQIMVESQALIFGSIGGVLGVILSLTYVAPALPDDYSKIIFVSCFLAFAINLFLLNRERKRATYLRIPGMNWEKRVALLITGIIGGVLSGIAGSGIDICMFSVLTLVFRLSEKTATPTSVVLMAGNTVTGFIYQWARGVIVRDAWIQLACASIVVPLGAPFGAFVSSFLHRQVLAGFVYFTDVTQFIMALAITQMNLQLWVTTTGCLIGALVIFGAMRALGTYQLRQALLLSKNRIRLLSHCTLPGIPSIVKQGSIVVIDDAYDLSNIEFQFESSEMRHERARWNPSNPVVLADIPGGDLSTQSTSVSSTLRSDVSSTGASESEIGYM